MVASHADIVEVSFRAPSHPSARPLPVAIVTPPDIEARYRAVFGPAEPAALTPIERFAVATFIAAVQGGGPTADFYAGELRECHGKIAETVLREARLAREGAPFRSYRLSQATRAFLGERLSTGLDYAHLLAFHRDDAASADERLLEVGWTRHAVAALADIVVFLRLQLGLATA